MNIRIIVNAFSQNIVNGQPQGEPVIVKVFDSIEDFKRKIELLPAYKELKETNEFFQEERKKIFNELKGNAENLSPKQMNEFTDKIEQILDTDCELKNKLKFTKKEIEDSGIKISEMVLIEEFINLK